MGSSDGFCQLDQLDQLDELIEFSSRPWFQCSLSTGSDGLSSCFVRVLETIVLRRFHDDHSWLESMLLYLAGVPSNRLESGDPLNERLKFKQDPLDLTWV